MSSDSAEQPESPRARSAFRELLKSKSLKLNANDSERIPTVASNAPAPATANPAAAIVTSASARLASSPASASTRITITPSLDAVQLDDIVPALQRAPTALKRAGTLKTTAPPPDGSQQMRRRMSRIGIRTLIGADAGGVVEWSKPRARTDGDDDDNTDSKWRAKRPSLMRAAMGQRSIGAPPSDNDSADSASSSPPPPPLIALEQRQSILNVPVIRLSLSGDEAAVPGLHDKAAPEAPPFLTGVWHILISSKWNLLLLLVPVALASPRFHSEYVSRCLCVVCPS